MTRLVVVLALCGFALGAVLAAWAGKPHVAPAHVLTMPEWHADFSSDSATTGWQRLATLIDTPTSEAHFIDLALDVAERASAEQFPFAAAHVLRGAWLPASRAALRTRAADRLARSGHHLSAARFLIAQSDIAAHQERDAQAACDLREHAELRLVSASSGWLMERCDNRRRWAGLIAVRLSASAAIAMLPDAAFSDASNPAELAAVYRGTLAAMATPPLVNTATLAALAQFTASTSTNAFRVLAAAYAAERLGSAQPAWRRRGQWLTLGASAAAVTSGAMDQLIPEAERLRVICDQRRSGIHATDPVKVCIWTWAALRPSDRSAP